MSRGLVHNPNEGRWLEQVAPAARDRAHERPSGGCHRGGCQAGPCRLLAKVEGVF